MNKTRIVDLSVLVSEDYPGGWPSHMPFQRKPINWYGKEGASEAAPFRVSGRGPYYTEWLIIDEHTGTHFDAAAHFMEDPSQVDGPYTGDQVDLAIFHGTAAVIDVSDLEEGAGPGISPEIPAVAIETWEQRNGRLEAGEVVLFRTAWDRYYVSGDCGRRYAHDVLVTAKTAGWPAPGVDAMKVLYDRGVRCVGTDAPSMGMSHDGVPVHRWGLSRGMVYIELLTNLAALPERGAPFVFLPIKVAGSSGGPGRAIAYLNED
ncbi:MAG TPA: cyclase family protein [Gammaproteobacteria bacterium]|nr:cyclase family protein [Gammaproteobacteria bacterium]